jgi:hypothetical protein
MAKCGLQSGCVRLPVYIRAPLDLVKALRASQNLPLPIVPERRMRPAPNKVHPAPHSGQTGLSIEPNEPPRDDNFSLTLKRRLTP